MPGSALLHLLGVDPLSEIGVRGEKMRKERTEPFAQFSVVGEVVRGGDREEADVADRGSYLRHQTVDIGKEGVSLPLVIRGKEVADTEDSIKFFLTIRGCVLGDVVTIKTRKGYGRRRPS